jgi:periplasmic protein TonB
LGVLAVQLNGKLDKILFNIKKMALNFAFVMLTIILTSYSFPASSDENSMRNESKSTSKETPIDINILLRKIADERERKRMERPRRRSSSEKAHYFPVDMYIEKWREKVETLMKVNYPIAAQAEHLHGNVMVTVSVMADGTVEAAKININSGPNILGDYVLDTIRKAAPYERFSDELNDYVDILTIEKHGCTLEVSRVLMEGKIVF